MKPTFLLETVGASPDLPELPVVKVKREANITPTVLAWFREQFAPSFVYKISDEAQRRLPFDAFMLGKHPAAIEIKVTTRKYISQSAVLPHQKLALQEVEKAGARGYVVAVFLHKDVRKALVIQNKHWTGATPSSACEFSFCL